MKKILLSSCVLFAFVFSNAQITLVDDAGNAIEDGKVFEFNTVEEHPAKLHFYLKNHSSNQTGVRAEMLEVTGSDGSEVQFCIGDCLFSVQVGTIVPSFNFPVGPNETTTGPGTYFWNLNTSSPQITYKFKVFEVDTFGNEIGTPTHITYKYDANMSVSELESSSIAQVSPTVIKGQTNVTLKENASVQVLNIEGKAVKSLKLNSGNSQIDLSGLSAGVYLIQFKGDSGKTTTTKVVVK